MKSLMWAVVAVCFAATLAMAADEGIAKPKSKKFHGVVSAKAADAAADVAAVLTCKGKGEGAADKTYNLVAAADAVKAQIEALVGKEVTVMGEEDGANLKVAAIAEKAAKPERKPKAPAQGGGEAPPAE